MVEMLRPQAYVNSSQSPVLRRLSMHMNEPWLNTRGLLSLTLSFTTEKLVGISSIPPASFQASWNSFTPPARFQIPLLFARLCGATEHRLGVICSISSMVSCSVGQTHYQITDIKTLLFAAFLFAQLLLKCMIRYTPLYAFNDSYHLSLVKPANE